MAFLMEKFMSEEIREAVRIGVVAKWLIAITQIDAKMV